MAESSRSFNNVTRQIAREDILNLNDRFENNKEKEKFAEATEFSATGISVGQLELLFVNFGNEDLNVLATNYTCKLVSEGEEENGLCLKS